MGDAKVLGTIITAINKAENLRGVERTDTLGLILKDCFSVKKSELACKEDELILDKYKGIIFYKLGKFDYSEQYLQHIVNDAETEDSEEFVICPVDVHRLLGVIANKQNNFGKAIKEFSLEIQEHPKNSEAYNDRGFVYFKIGEFDKAIKSFDSAIRYDKNNYTAIRNKGKLQILEGAVEQAFNNFQKILNTNEMDADALFYSGLLRTHVDASVAEPYFRKLLGDTGNERLLCAYAALYLEEFDVAYDYFEQFEQEAKTLKERINVNLFKGDWNRLQKENQDAEISYTTAIKQFLELHTKTTLDYLTVERAADGLRRIGIPQSTDVLKKGVIGVDSLDLTMVSNYCKIYP